jgi:hypothetical protein
MRHYSRARYRYAIIMQQTLTMLRATELIIRMARELDQVQDELDMTRQRTCELLRN